MGTLEVVGYSDGDEENFTRILEKKVCVCVSLSAYCDFLGPYFDSLEGHILLTLEQKLSKFI